MSEGRGTRRELSEMCGPQYGCAPVEMREQVLRTYPATPAESAAARAVAQ